MNSTRLGFILAVVLLGLTPVIFAAGEARTIPLPKPKMSGGKPLMDALRERRSTKTVYSARKVTTATLSNMLWAAYGVNRPASGGRTVPSGLKSYEIDVYVLLKSGAYVYDPLQHTLKTVTREDLRVQAGGTEALKDAAVELLYVADHTRLTKVKEDRKAVYSAVHTGFIGQNVYLFCASEGLATVFREGADREKLIEKLGLRKGQEVVFAQTVGYAK